MKQAYKACKTDTAETAINIVTLISIFLFFFTGTSFANQDSTNPVEVGHVKWERDYKVALEQSKNSQKPIFLLFQEVPGCIGCQNFGQEVLTHPLLVEAIEELFVPVLVFNNRATGDDVELMKLFQEPSWNYQVIRFIDAEGQDIIPRKDKVWSIGGVAKRMIAALQRTGREVPLYLQAVAVENDEANLGLAGFAMACFWTGEYKLGKIEGVVSTEAGWYDNREITLVRYHQSEIELAGLVKIAEKEQCAQAVYTEKRTNLDQSRFTLKPLVLNEYRVAAADHQKKQIQQWLEHQEDLHLTPMQLVKINAFMPDDPGYALRWLSPRQLKLVKR